MCLNNFLIIGSRNNMKFIFFLPFVEPNSTLHPTQILLMVHIRMLK